jgi:membrane-bound lytic murein transglycosylase A
MRLAPSMHRLALLGALTLGACAPRVPTPPAAPTPVPPPVEKLALEAVGFADLPGWSEDRHHEALAAFVTSCRRITAMSAAQGLGGGGIAGNAGDWSEACQAANGIGADGADARRFFEFHFAPFRASNDGKAEGLFTGYYEPELRGSRRSSARFTVPLYKRPNDLVTVDLGQFRESLRGQTIAGKVSGGALQPYDNRARIESGALRGKGLELVWVDDPVEAFFLQVQGSGRVVLEDGRIMRVGYAAQNGHGYIAIGRVLRDRGLLDPADISLQTIRAWLRANPGQAAAMMNENPSFVFFREITGEGPLGAQGVALTPGRSLAVDRTHHALGVPVWLVASHPDADSSKPDLPLRRLMIAQDTGGAIRGPVRGDVFWGHGREAEEIAGRMKHQGVIYLLLPKAVAEKRRATS